MPSFVKDCKIHGSEPDKSLEVQELALDSRT